MCHAAASSCNKSSDDVAHRGVEAARGLVEHEHGSSQLQCADECEPLLLAAAEVGTAFVELENRAGSRPSLSEVKPAINSRHTSFIRMSSDCARAEGQVVADRSDE